MEASPYLEQAGNPVAARIALRVHAKPPYPRPHAVEHLPLRLFSTDCLLSQHALARSLECQRTFIDGKSSMSTHSLALHPIPGLPLETWPFYSRRNVIRRMC